MNRLLSCQSKLIDSILKLIQNLCTFKISKDILKYILINALKLEISKNNLIRGLPLGGQLLPLIKVITTFFLMILCDSDTTSNSNLK